MKKINSLIVVLFCFIFLQGQVYEIKPSHSAFEHNNKGVTNLENQYFYEAAQEFKLAISVNPNTPETAIFYSNLAKVYQELNLYDAGIFCLEQSIKLDGNKLNYFKNLVNIYKEKQSLIEAKEIYKLKVTNNPNDYNSILILALIYEQMGENLKAINSFYDYKELKPNCLINRNIDTIIKDLVIKVKSI